MFRSEIEKEEINKLEVRTFEGDIRIIDSMNGFRESIREIRRFPMVGFDTETRPSFRKGRQNSISLIQISNSDVAWLYRVNRIGIPAELKALLEDEAVLKVGAGLMDDMRRLRQLVHFEPGGFLDLQKYVEAFRIESKSLKKMVAIILGYKISKSQQLSDWESEVLTEQQARYAATDAWVCLEIYKKLRKSVNLYQ